MLEPRAPLDVLAVLGSAVRIDPDADRTDESERVVEQRPLEVGLREDRERVALLYSEREQPVGELVDHGSRLLPGDLFPPALLLDEVRRACPIRCDRVEPEAGDRLLAAAGFGLEWLGLGDLGGHPLPTLRRNRPGQAE